MKYLVIIPARGGSKGVPGKNIRPLKGKPLIHYTVEAARSLFNDSDICVSTDSDEIKKVVEQIGLKVPFIRPKELSQDSSGSHEVILHALDFYEKKGFEPEAVILLQPTSPLRTAKHIEEAVKLFGPSLDMVVSVKESSSNPYYNLFEEDSSGFLKKSKKGSFVRRQDCPPVWEYNGAIYVINVNSIKKNRLHNLSNIKKYVMDDISSIDIDTELDFKLAEFIMTNKYYL
ncbi:MAG: acylneuraminate cytidylyltransferase family protein [Balneola sp.]|nr:acylneuraminate cytidylyltransferase family protein [Balneola sp.]MBO6651939.1 acylneuraminate cytidylyltransferase family protein [Balneola sp.]MBO6711774.1 acylneuraminate cytidylyltransferase family protein [Balneola sp.]MBO6799968.1 acylneuraminate cytidylyltransferase family protein [Balneola sp.]MBO6871213.1 acylneuraminate cytidylyltransferase family protein [Balneola sp.]